MDLPGARAPKTSKTGFGGFGGYAGDVCAARNDLGYTDCKRCATIPRPACQPDVAAKVIFTRRRLKHKPDAAVAIEPDRTTFSLPRSSTHPLDERQKVLYFQQAESSRFRFGDYLGRASMRSWVIGNSPECDVVVDSPLASARHCQLTQTPEGYFLNDLGSTNGTHVNGMRITTPTRLTTGDSITLGRTVPFPWPPELTTSIGIGRLAGNDIVLDDARVSGHHARLIVVAGFQIFIEDSGSSNGTFLNSADRRVTSTTPVTELDTLYFGTLAVPAARLLAGLMEREQAATARPPSPAVSAEDLDKPSARLPTIVAWEENRWLLAWLAQALVFAVLIVLILGRQTAAATWESVGHGIAATTFALALAATWLGCSLAVAAVAAPRSALPVGKRLAIHASLCPVTCAILLAVVYWGNGLMGPWLAMWGVLVMTSLVGFFLGLAVSNPVRIRAAAASMLLIFFVAMIALGGWIWPLPKMSPPVQLVAEAMPSRWAFEGLFLLETDQHSAMAAPAETEPTQNHDPVEYYFPADSEQMGVTADATALGSMLIGLAALALFISGPLRPGP